MAPHYTEDQRQQVMEMLRANRFDVAHVARELGISRQTIYNWMDESGDEDLSKMSNVSNMSKNFPKLRVQQCCFVNGRDMLDVCML